MMNHVQMTVMLCANIPHNKTVIQQHNTITCDMTWCTQQAQTMKEEYNEIIQQPTTASCACNSHQNNMSQVDTTLDFIRT